MSIRRLTGSWVGGLFVVLILATTIWNYIPKSAAKFEAEGRAALARRDLSFAVESFEQSVKSSPERVSAWKLLADSACHDGQADRSYEAMKVVVRLAPDEANSLCLQLGGRWMAKNRIQPAMRTLRLAIVANSQPPQPFRLLAQIYGVIGNRREVVGCLIELLKRKEFTLNDLKVLSSVNPGVHDPQRLQMIMKADPTDKSPLLSVVMQKLDQNHIEEAKRYLIEIITADPENAEAQGILGELYADFQSNEFLQWHERLLPATAKDARVWLARGKWLNSIGESETAVRCLHEAFMREPENLSAVALLGQLLKSLGEVELGNAFTERGRRLQRIIDLNQRMNDPRGNESILPMIEELEATGRLWEAWGWCLTYPQMMQNSNDQIDAARKRLELQLRYEMPRTDASTLPGIDADWDRYALPNWSQLKSRATLSEPTDQSGPSSIQFEDRAEQAQLDFRYVNTTSQESGHKIYETMGAGVAVLDLDLDGWLDLYFPQGKSLPLESADGPGDAIYRNAVGTSYRDVTNAAGIHETTYSQGVAAGDFDNDGFPDLYVANLGRNRLYHNNGDGTFTDVTDEAGIQQHVWTVSCAIADLNGDALPELFDVNYVQGKELLTATCYDQNRRPVVCRPTVFDATLDTVSKNLGDGRFQEMQDEVGLNLPLGMGLGLVIADFNDDNRLDVFIANDMNANFLLINDSINANEPPRFRDEAFLRGVALDLNGLAQACMGVTYGDINHDGRPDLFVTNFARESNTIYISLPGGLYEDQTLQSGLREPSFEPLGFGTQFIDADRDGWLDLVVMNGHIDEFVDEPFRMKAQLFSGQPDGHFYEVKGSQAGSLFEDLRLARGLAKLDWNRDGRTDFVATDLEKPVLLAENTTQNDNHGLRLKLVGTKSSRDAIGGKVTVVVTNGDERIYQLTAGDGYESSNEHLIEVGTGSVETVQHVEVRWPSGTVSHFEDVACDEYLVLVEGHATLVPILFD